MTSTEPLNVNTSAFNFEIHAGSEQAGDIAMNSSNVFSVAYTGGLAGTATISGDIAGTSDSFLRTFTNSKLVLTGTNSRSGDTVVLGNGLLQINGSYTSPITVTETSTLGRSGTLNGGLEINSGAALSPGNSPGVTTINGNFDLADGSTLEIELGGGGNNPGVAYDQVIVSGTATLAGELDLSLYSNITSTVDPFIIIDVAGNNPVSLVGEFSNLAEGETIVMGSTAFTIEYFAGDGNDVALTASNITNYDAIWIGEGDGVNWSDTANWSGGVLPGASDDVFINPAGSNSIHIDVDVTINSITSDEPVTIADNQTLNLSQTSIFNQGLIIDGGEISSTATVEVYESSTLDGTINVNGFENYGTLDIIGSNSQMKGTLSNFGTVNQTVDALLNPGTFTNQSGAIYNLDSAELFRDVTGHVYQPGLCSRYRNGHRFGDL